MKAIIEDNLHLIVFALVLALVIVLMFAFALRPTMNRVEWQEELYTVKSGDSLWSLSGKYCPNNVDCREWINQVRILNDLEGSTIYPGQALIILVTQEV